VGRGLAWCRGDMVSLHSHVSRVTKSGGFSFRLEYHGECLDNFTNITAASLTMTIGRVGHLFKLCQTKSDRYI